MLLFYVQWVVRKEIDGGVRCEHLVIETECAVKLLDKKLQKAFRILAVKKLK